MKARIEDRVIYSPYPRIDIPVCSFYALAKEKLLNNPNKIALVGGDLSLTRAEVLASMQRYAIGFRQNGMLPGDHVSIHLNNRVESLIAMYGCILAGATVFLPNASLTEHELRYEVEDGDCTHILTDEPNAEKFKRAVAGLKLKTTAAQMFPGNLRALVREMAHTGRTLPSMRAIAVGGSSFSTLLAEECRNVFGGLEVLVQVYGMTEACSLITSRLKNEDFGISADVGFPTPNVTIKVVDVLTGQKLGPHQTGEVRYRTESMMRGYYKRPKETADIIDEDGWSKSGDAGYYDEDGRLYIVERLKEMIRCLDDTVIPTELEERLLREYASDIAEVAVVGLPHPEYGEAPAAAVVLTDEGSKKDSELLAEKIKAAVASSHAVHKHLYGGVFFMDSLPKTDTGKICRATLASRLARL